MDNELQKAWQEKLARVRAVMGAEFAASLEEVADEYRWEYGQEMVMQDSEGRCWG